MSLRIHVCTLCSERLSVVARRVCTNSVNTIKNIPFPCRVRVQTVLMSLKTCVTVPSSVCINSVNGIKKKARENDDSAPPLKFNLISHTRIHPSVRPFASAQSDATVNAIGPFCSCSCSSDPRFGTLERERARLSRTTSRLGTRVPFSNERSDASSSSFSRPGSRRRRRVDGRA